MSDAKLTERQQMFVDEYLVDFNGTGAYKRAGYTASSKAANVNSARLLTDPRIQAYIQQRMQDRSKRTEITQDMVLQHWLSIATADPNDLMFYRRVCCRHCFGKDHEYQWIDDVDYVRAVVIAQEEKQPKPTNKGGYGFDRTIRPHPKCPKCHGEGYGEIKANDTRDVTPQAKLLFAGVKQTQAGFEIKMHDQDKAWENIARHLGMFVDKVEHSGGIVAKIVDYSHMSEAELAKELQTYGIDTE